MLTLEQAEQVASATLAAIEAAWEPHGSSQRHLDADEDRVNSDLAGLRLHHSVKGQMDNPGLKCAGHSRFSYGTPWPCSDARRYSDGLRRTAALYGVTL